MVNSQRSTANVNPRPSTVNRQPSTPTLNAKRGREASPRCGGGGLRRSGCPHPSTLTPHP
eukprot:1923093-Rhodomonas_salina.1